MKPVLLLNHAVLEGLAYRASAGDDEACRTARQPVVEIGDTLQRTRRVRQTQAVLFVHQALSGVEVSEGQSFISWANQHLRNPLWGNTLELLLQLVSGPWVQSLEVDGPPPTDTVPSCLGVPDWLVEMLLIAAHHGLSHGRSSFILSYGPNPYLDRHMYAAQRGDAQIELFNLRTDNEAAEAEAASGRNDAETTLAVLETATLYTSRVRVLESARRSAKRWELDCRPSLLFEAIRGLDAYACALDEGLSREVAADRYKQSCGVDMSQEKAQTLKKPSLRKQREFEVPGLAKRELFDMHAKPGNTRVHVFARKEPKDENDPAKGAQTVVYIGHCGVHLDRE